MRTWIFGHCSDRERQREDTAFLLYWHAEPEVQVPYMAFSELRKKCVSSSPLREVKALASTRPLLTHSSGEAMGPVTARMGQKSGLLTQSSPGRGVWSQAPTWSLLAWGEWGYIFFYGVWLKHSGYYLGVFYFANLLVPGPLAKKCWLLLELFSLPLGCSGLLASSAPHLGYMISEKKNQ